MQSIATPFLLLLVVRASAVAFNQNRHRLQHVQEVQAVARQVSGGRPAATFFGPNGCVGLSRSAEGTCKVTTECGSADISGVEFAFVCYNPASTMAHALHSFGRGGFAAAESFDSGVHCNQCTSVDFALRSGSTLLRSSAVNAAPSANIGESLYPLDTAANKPAETAFYGPSACIATFLSPQSTCMIQTRCRGVDLDAFTVGVTCLDHSGDYTRFIFGRDGFNNEETFDTLIQCKACIGSGDSSPSQMSGLLPKNLVQDVSLLKSEVQLLRQTVVTLGSISSNATEVNDTTPKFAAAPSPGSPKGARPQTYESFVKAPSPGGRTAPYTLASAPSTGGGPQRIWGTIGGPVTLTDLAPTVLAPAPSFAAAPATRTRFLRTSLAGAPSPGGRAPSFAVAPTASLPATKLFRTSLAGAPSPIGRTPSFAAAPAGSLPATRLSRPSLAGAPSPNGDAASAASLPGMGLLRTRLADAPSPNGRAPSFAAAPAASLPTVGLLRTNSEVTQPNLAAAPVFPRTEATESQPPRQRIGMTVRDLLRQLAH